MEKNLQRQICVAGRKRVFGIDGVHNKKRKLSSQTIIDSELIFRFSIPVSRVTFRFVFRVSRNTWPGSKKVSVEILERIAFSIVTLTRSTFVPSVKTDGELLCSSLTRSDKGNDATNRESKFYKVVASSFPSTFPYPILTFACNACLQ